MNANVSATDRVASVHADRLRGCLLAGAVGDALGAPLEFLDLAAIRARYGNDGATAYDVAYGRRGALTDDTQMTIYTLEGLLRASVRSRDKGIVHVPSIVASAYLRWLGTQDPDLGITQDGWLAGVKDLHTQRAPGRTCLSALSAIRSGHEPGTTRSPINDSKGCGAVMRVAPAGFWTADVAAAYELGCDLAALTHGHPTAWASAGLVAAMVSQLVRGHDLPAALSAARLVLADRDPNGETLSAVDAAVAIAESGRPRAEDLERLGAGWVAEEAVAIALAAAMGGDLVIDALVLSVNHSGDSDSTGAICGHLVGAAHGAANIPDAWLADLELRDVIDELARDAVVEFGGAAPVPDLAWLDRYPPN